MQACGEGRAELRLPGSLPWFMGLRQREAGPPLTSVARPAPACSRQSKGRECISSPNMTPGVMVTDGFSRRGRMRKVEAGGKWGRRGWEWTGRGKGHLSRPPFSWYQRVFFIQTIVDFFSIRSKISSSVKAFKIHKGPQPACSFGRNTRFLLEVLRFPAVESQPAPGPCPFCGHRHPLPSSWSSQHEGCPSSAKTNFHHPVRRWHNCTDFIWSITMLLEAINASCA